MVSWLLATNSGAEQFKFTYKLPDGIVGDKILIQWRYVTANSCFPPGYKNSEVTDTLRTLGWLRSEGMSDCNYPLDPTGTGTPEQVSMVGEETPTLNLTSLLTCGLIFFSSVLELCRDFDIPQGEQTSKCTYLSTCISTCISACICTCITTCRITNSYFRLL